MKAGALVLGLVLIVIVPARAQHGGRGHSGGLGGGHFGGGHTGVHLGGHPGHGRSRVPIAGRFSGAAFSHLGGPPQLTTFVGFGSAPGIRFFFVTDGFFCPFVPHLVFPFCRFCGLRPFGVFGGGFFGVAGFGFFDDSETWFGTGVVSGTTVPPVGSSQAVDPVLVFTNGWSFEVTDYWIDDEGELRYATTYRGMNIVALQSLDFYATAKKNEERGISFALKLRHGQ